ncbi:MAG: hypothetical protein HN793_02985 [Rhodospirillaceae bacterium]|nr:hypothetical protein [Rhodospirillaceae bacterium]MBT5241944.1 hypothetical protein [Rhodospirillaceae bacterium]MBT5567093.1 hypothetical protein [Rhodospirillaceae bacterium]MBT6961244.1 hypothetical protein [Rhodospirillaceae bacterium]MBT7449770.1 hypothetical protein [Rhodospirillaceae bacterium]
MSEGKSKPASVVYFETLQYLSWFVYVCGRVILFVDDPEYDLAWITALMVVLVVSYGAIVSVVFLIVRRHEGWTRWVFVGFLIWISPEVFFSAESTIIKGTEIAFLVLYVISMFFVFSKDSNAWFRNADDQAQAG